MRTATREKDMRQVCDELDATRPHARFGAVRTWFGEETRMDPKVTLAVAAAVVVAVLAYIFLSPSDTQVSAPPPAVSTTDTPPPAPK